MIGSSLCIAVHIESIGAHESTAYDFALHDRAAGLFEINGPAFIEREQGKLRDRIGAVILLQHVDRVFARGIAQDHRIGLEVHGDAVHIHHILARLQIEREFLADHGEILVIDGE
jgi:hypothetical protein